MDLPSPPMLAVRLLSADGLEESWVVSEIRVLVVRLIESITKISSGSLLVVESTAEEERGGEGTEDNRRLERTNEPETRIITKLPLTHIQYHILI